MCGLHVSPGMAVLPVCIAKSTNLTRGLTRIKLTQTSHVVESHFYQNNYHIIMIISLSLSGMFHIWAYMPIMHIKYEIQYV